MKGLKQYITEFVVKKHVNKDSYESVDLDLPSGTKWCNCNIGSTEPTDPGLLFQWGRVDGYAYKAVNNKFLAEKDFKTNSGNTYNTRGQDILTPEDDAAYQATNGEYRMPTADEFKELVKNTNITVEFINDVKGFKCSSLKDETKYIFIPMNGWKVGYSGFYNKPEAAMLWTSKVLISSYGGNSAIRGTMFPKHQETNAENIADAYCIRPVLNK